jgi:hypothetical protein
MRHSNEARGLVAGEGIDFGLWFVALTEIATHPHSRIRRQEFIFDRLTKYRAQRAKHPADCAHTQTSPPACHDQVAAILSADA